MSSKGWQEVEIRIWGCHCLKLGFPWGSVVGGAIDRELGNLVWDLEKSQLSSTPKSNRVLCNLKTLW